MGCNINREIKNLKRIADTEYHKSIPKRPKTDALDNCTIDKDNNMNLCSTDEDKMDVDDIKRNGKQSESNDDNDYWDAMTMHCEQETRNTDSIPSQFSMKSPGTSMIACEYEHRARNTDMTFPRFDTSASVSSMVASLFLWGDRCLHGLLLCNIGCI